MPVACAGPVAVVDRHYVDLDNTYVYEVPPNLNQWYTALDEPRARLLVCFINQTNTVPQNRTVEVRWTIDGNVYLLSVSLASGTGHYVWRNFMHAGMGGAPLISGTAYRAAVFYLDKRGQNVKVEVRITSAPAAGQTLACYVVAEREAVVP